jgi:hypothetical protein
MPNETAYTVSRVQPLSINPMLKEAVAEGLLHTIYNRVAGEGEYGDILYGDKPSNLLSAGFLLPADQPGEGDDSEISPIKIVGTGIDLQVGTGEQGIIEVKGLLSIYVRVLPNIEDFEKHPLHFLLNTETNREVRNEADNELSNEFRVNPDKFGGRKWSPEWKKRRTELRLAALQRRGIMPAPEDDIPASDDDSNDDELPVSTDELFFNFALKPGMHASLPDDVVGKAAPVPKWIRLEVEAPPFELDPSQPFEKIKTAIEESNTRLRKVILNRIVNWLDDEDLKTGGKLWAFPKRARFLPSQILSWEKTLEEVRAMYAAASPEGRLELAAIPIFDLQWCIEAKQDWADTSRQCLHVALENKSLRPDTNKIETEEAVFQVAITCRVPKTLHRHLRLDRVKPSYRYNIYLHYQAMGYNCGVQVEKGKDEILLTTTWLPKYELPKIVPTLLEGVDTNFSKLADPKYSLESVSAIPNCFLRWVDSLEGWVDPLQGIDEDDEHWRGNERQAFETDKDRWRNEAAAIQRGIEILSRAKDAGVDTPSGAPFKAWLLVNKTMQQYAAGKYENWRLFQVAFILANIPAIVTRMPEYKEDFDPDWDEAVSLLYFATGGGKSEAFFGLMVFNLFLDRLRGKVFGVTAMIHYPLRLLTIQQAQRAAHVLAQAEMVRLEMGIPGQPFSIGFWVGSSNTPNNHNDAKGIPSYERERQLEEVLLDNNTEYRRAVTDWNKLPECPFCGHATGLRRYTSMGGLIGHTCFEEECFWNIKTRHAPLPFYIVDVDIYALAPAVLLGTVDKLALIGQSPLTIRRIMGMFGVPQWYAPDTGRLEAVSDRQKLIDGPAAYNMEGVFPCYAEGARLFHDPFPSLIIQDETHLLEESLGTFAGLFETTLFETFRRLAGIIGETETGQPVSMESGVRLPKVIAASATVSEPERQMESLYQKRLKQFPYPGPTLYHSFYSEPEYPEGTGEVTQEDVERYAMRRRLYASILTNGKPHTTVTVAVLGAFHLTITILMQMLCSRSPDQQDRVKEILAQAIPPGHRQSECQNLVREATADELATLVDLHRVALTYVTNKKGGDQILSAEGQEVFKLLHKEGIELRDFKCQLISGAVDTGMIQKIVRDVERRPAVGEPFPKLDDELRSVVATSAVSHGVDVEEFNSMFFAGMPSDIAEYIQASSRVGRAHVGFCLLLPVPQRKRDRYIVEIHDAFHRFLERMVLPAALDRWAEKAIQRVIPSFIQTWLCGIKALEEFCETSTDEKVSAKTYANTDDVRIEYDSDSLKLRDDIVGFICEGIGLSGEDCVPQPDYYRDLIRDRVNGIIEDMTDRAGRLLREFFVELARDNPGELVKPMTSLRDVEFPGRISPDPFKGQLSRRLSDSQFKELMSFLRRGGGASVDLPLP